MTTPPWVPLLTISLSLLLSAATTFAAAVSPSLDQQVEREGRAPALVFLEETADHAAFTPSRQSAEPLIRSLMDVTERTQPALVSALRTAGYDGEVKRFWITNAISLDLDAPMLEWLSNRSEVVRIDLDEAVAGPQSVSVEREAPTSRFLPWGIDRIGASSVWTTHGLDGSGIVVGVLDTGADVTHPAIGSKWRGGTNSWIDLINGQPAPYDDHGRGTHVTGTVLGGDGPGAFDPDIGVAYGAIHFGQDPRRDQRRLQLLDRDRRRAVHARPRWEPRNR